MAGPRLGVASAGTSLYQALCIAIAGGEAAMRWLSSRLAARGERYRRGVVRNRAVALCSGKHYISRAGLRGALEYIPRGLTISTGAVPVLDPGLGHMAPTYLCRFPGSQL